VEFEWDESKNTANQKKHGLDFLEATECFFDPHGIELIDDKHSKSEKRFFWVGQIQKRPSAYGLVHKTEERYPYYWCSPIAKDEEIL
jgi:uncharacterized DUF497 family protein